MHTLHQYLLQETSTPGPPLILPVLLIFVFLSPTVDRLAHGSPDWLPSLRSQRLLPAGGSAWLWSTLPASPQASPLVYTEHRHPASSEGYSERGCCQRRVAGISSLLRDLGFPDLILVFQPLKLSHASSSSISGTSRTRLLHPAEETSVPLLGGRAPSQTVPGGSGHPGQSLPFRQLAWVSSEFTSRSHFLPVFG